MILLFLLLLAAVDLAAKPPNIVLILADDLAWSDPGCYGGRLCETPRIDRLASEGMRFTDAYAAAPLCSPSRAALLTGKTPARLNFEFVTKWADDRVPLSADHKLLPPPYTLNLPLEETTLAEALAQAGYRTGMVGKWHLNAHHETYNGWSPVFGPRQQGFEYAVETFGSHPWAFRDGDEDLGEIREGEYAPDGLTDAAIEFLERDDDERPFFLFVSHFYVHTPVRARGEWLVEKYRRKLGPGASEKAVLYGGFVETLDYHVGRFLDALDRLGRAEDTVVVFTSDNGGHPEYALNAPLRGGKWHLYEGGIRAPFVARWPGVVERGSVADTPVTGTDLFATFAAMAGAESASGVDSRDLSLLLRQGSDTTLDERALIWHFPYYHPEKDFADQAAETGIGKGVVSQTRPVSAIRVGRYKLLYFYDDERVELYDLKSDLGEQRDLSGERPELAEELRKQLQGELAEAGARLPTNNPRRQTHDR